MSEKNKILVVDDDEDFVEATKMVLESQGYEVSVAHDGASGIEKAKADRPDLMLLDVMMATQSEGFDVARKIPQTPELQDLPVLLVTGIRDAMKVKFKFEPDETWLPVERVLEKPAKPEVLLEEVKRALGR